MKQRLMIHPRRYSYVRGQHGSFDQPMDVLRSHLETIRRSVYAEMPTDHVLRVCVSLSSFPPSRLEALRLTPFFSPPPAVTSRSASSSSTPSSRSDPVCELSNSRRTITKRSTASSVSRSSDWSNGTGPGTSTWTSSRSGETVKSVRSSFFSYLSPLQKLTFLSLDTVKSQVPFAHGRMALALYIFRDIPAADIDRNDPRVREFARMGVESSLVILRWGVESRIWMP